MDGNSLANASVIIYKIYRFRSRREQEENNLQDPQVLARIASRRLQSDAHTAPPTKAPTPTAPQAFSNGIRFTIDRPRVISSAYSKLSPMAIPRAIVVTFRFGYCLSWRSI